MTRPRRSPPPPSSITFAPVAEVPVVAWREDGDAPVVTFAGDAPTGPRGEPLVGHTDFVQALAFSPDGRVLVTGSEDSTLRVWDPATRACLRTLTAHAGAVNALAFTPDGARLLTASDDRTVRVWDVATWEVTRVLEGHQGCVSEVRAAGHDRAASCGDDGTVRLWDLATGACLREMQQSSWVNAMDVSPDGTLAVASNTHNVLRVWDLATGARDATLVDASGLYAGTVMGMIVAGENRGAGHGSFARHVAWAPDGARFSTTSKEIIAWDAATGAEVARVEGDGWGIAAVARVPGTSLLAAASHEAIALYDLDAGALVACAPWDHGGDTHMVAVSPDGTRLACGAQDGVVGLWSVAALRAGGVPSRHVRTAFAVAASPDGTAALTGGADRSARLWDLAAGTSRQHTFAAGLFVSPVQFTRDGRRAVVTNDAGEIAALDVRTGACLGRGRHPEADRYRPFLVMRELRDGRWLVGSSSGPLARWDLDALADGPTLFADDAGQVSSLDVDPAEQVAVSAAYANGLLDVRAWDLPAGTLRWRATFAAPGYASGVRVVGARVAVTTAKGGLMVLSLDDGALQHALDLAPDEYLLAPIVTGPDEVVVPGRSPARVDLAEGRCTARFAPIPDAAWMARDGDTRALCQRGEALAVADFAAGTLTPWCEVGAATNATSSPGSPFVALAPRSPEASGSVRVLRVPRGEGLVIPSPTLAPRAATKRPANARAAKPPPTGGEPAKKAPAKKAPAKKAPAKKARVQRPPDWVPTHPAPARDVTHRYGVWTFVVGGLTPHDVVLWNDAARTAVELHAGSNGWWHLRTKEKEFVVWPYGGASPQDFFARPWQSPLPAHTREVAAGEVLEIHQGNVGTVLRFDDDALRVTFSDGRGLTLPRRGDRLDFDGRTGRQILSTGSRSRKRPA
ncbi:MAG: WD40 repeat domain-containing protein [Polyangiales bacterium]